MLNHPTWMKLGDQFWFEPLMHTMQRAGVQITVDCTGSMKDYFSELGYTILKMEDWTNIDLVLTRNDLVRFCLRKLTVPILSVDTADFSLRHPICQEMVDNTLKLLGMQSERHSYRPRVLQGGDISILQPFVGKAWLVSDQVGSGNFRIWSSDRRELWKDVARKRNEGFTIIYVGSEAERVIPLPEPNLVDFDLRGTLPLTNLIRICQLPEIEGVICFDGFLSHLFEASGKAVAIHYRRQFTTRKRNAIRRYYHPPFPIEDDC